MVDHLRNENRKIVQIYAEIIAEAVMSDSDENLDFIFDKIITQIQFPIIHSDKNGIPQSWKNVPVNWKNKTDIKQNQDIMDQFNPPIELVYTIPNSNIKQNLGFLHFGDSILINRLQWMPYIEIAGICLFIFLGVLGFAYIRKTEMNNIWTGMAKETAHQLGTPVSALIGWIERLKTHPKTLKDIIPEIESDINRLEQVGNRFGKIGSLPVLNQVEIHKMIRMVVHYLNRRLPSKTMNILIENSPKEEFTIRANQALLSWAIENIIKNGLDSIQSNTGRVKIRITQNSDRLFIRIMDNGSGIPRRHWKRIFQPGFTTKKHGWGFGLSLSKRVISELHNGNIYVLNSDKQNGTTVEIQLPGFLSTETRKQIDCTEDGLNNQSIPLNNV